MATKPLKTLTFEGLNDTYTVPQVDATLSVTGGAADAKAVGDTLAEKADKDGVIATAEGLIGGAYTIEKEPYHFRKTAVDLAGRLDETIVGGSLAWNQLVQNGDFANNTAWQTSYSPLAISNNEATLVSDKTNIVGSALYQNSSNLQANHVYITTCLAKTSNTPYIRTRWPVQSRDVSLSNDGNYHQYLFIVKAGTEKPTAIGFQVIKNNVGDESTVSYKEVNAIDLTQLFGTTIADYIYTLEQGTAGAGVAWVKRYIDLETYHEYDAGSIQSVEGLQSHKTYDEDENLLATYPLDSSVTLRGVPKLVTDHIEFDGDRYHADGSVERRYGIVDLGTLSWSYVDSWNAFRSSGITDAKPHATNTTIGIICAIPYTQLTSGMSASAANMTIILNLSAHAPNTLAIKNTAYADVAAFKTAMSGVYLVYELATPTTETAQPFQSPMIVGATEEYISDSVVPVGHESKYYEDVAKKVSGLPKDFSTLIAPTEVTFTATRNYSVGNYLIVKNQLYKVTSAISSGGTITPNSNVTATTIMAEILALA